MLTESRDAMKLTQSPKYLQLHPLSSPQFDANPFLRVAAIRPI